MKFVIRSQSKLKLSINNYLQVWN